MIKKGQVEEVQSALSEVKFFNQIMEISAYPTFSPKLPHNADNPP